MVFISRTMSALGYSSFVTEFVTSSIATWANKINMIVNAIAAGLTISLIPYIVEAFTKKNWSLVEERLNKALQLVLVVSIPLVLIISILAGEVWSIFYGWNSLGTIVLRLEIFTALFYNLNTVCMSTLQGLNKIKTVYWATIVGYLCNAILDVPLMLLFNYFHWPIFYGALVSSIIGLFVSTFLGLKDIKKFFNVGYARMFRTLRKTLVISLVMVLVVFLLKIFFPISGGKFMVIIETFFISLLGLVVYFLLLIKAKVLDDFLGPNWLDVMLKKLTFWKK